MLKRDSAKCDLERRAFISGLLSVPPGLFLAQWAWANGVTRSAAPRLSQRAYRGVQNEVDFFFKDAQGEIPAELRGTLFRIGPGSKETFGTPLQHFFDGDAYLTAFRFSSGGLQVSSRFIDTEERQSEISARRMLYNEYGTLSPQKSHEHKNPPNINILMLNRRLMAFSEADHPVEIDFETLASKGKFDFFRTLPRSVSFTAHPKQDPDSKITYMYGISRSVRPKLHVYRQRPGLDFLELLYEIPLGGFYPIHDMLMTKHHLLFVISPLKISLFDAATARVPLAQALRYEPDQPLRILVLDKEAVTPPIEIESSPSAMIFHHIDAYEGENPDHIIFHSLLMPDDQIFKVFSAWSKAEAPAGPRSWITRFELNLREKRVLLREEISDGTPMEFPCVDQSLLGQKQPVVYLLENQLENGDALSFTSLARWNLESRSVVRVPAEPHQVFGEAVLAENWLLHMGYDAQRNESFLDVRRPETLERRTRIWLKHYIPIGFHGSYISQD